MDWYGEEWTRTSANKRNHTMNYTTHIGTLEEISCDVFVTVKTTWNRNERWTWSIQFRFVDSFRKRNPLCLKMCYSFVRLDSAMRYSLLSSTLTSLSVVFLFNACYLPMIFAEIFHLCAHLFSFISIKF